jgi:hypothetical protein
LPTPEGAAPAQRDDDSVTESDSEEGEKIDLKGISPLLTIILVCIVQLKELESEGSVTKGASDAMKTWKRKRKDKFEPSVDITCKKNKVS